MLSGFEDNASGFSNGKDDGVSDEPLYLNTTVLVPTFYWNNEANKSELGSTGAWEQA